MTQLMLSMKSFFTSFKLSRKKKDSLADNNVHGFIILGRTMLPLWLYSNVIIIRKFCPRPLGFLIDCLVCSGLTPDFKRHRLDLYRDYLNFSDSDISKQIGPKIRG